MIATVSRMLFLSGYAGILLMIISCTAHRKTAVNPEMKYNSVNPSVTGRVISREAYHDQLEGFWLGACLANWTGLITEMDKIGNIGDIKTGAFYTRHDWGKPDQPNIWSTGTPGDLSATIDFAFANPDSIWGADDDTDVEFMYQELLLQYHTSLLTPEQIRDGWLTHIKPEEENYLWVSNQKAFDLMKSGRLPPETGSPENNPECEMIDAQLTTEIFGLYAPARPDIALKMAWLPVRTTGCENSIQISEFYIALHSLASAVDHSLPLKEQILWMAEQAKKYLPENSYPSKMYEYVKSKYEEGLPWEQTRDSVYYRYQIEQKDGYNFTSRNLYCNGCYAAGINFAASLISLFYGEGDLMETIKIGALAGWDSDNPTATWGGLLGFMIGKEGIEKKFGRKFSVSYNIHRTRRGFANNGIDSFDQMAAKGIRIIDQVVLELMHGSIDLKGNKWQITEK